MPFHFDERLGVKVVNDLYEDAEGNLWVGTPDHGALFWDGATTTGTVEISDTIVRDNETESGGGGIENGVDAFERIRAGASLVQLYTALVYEGPGLAERINGELRRLLALHGFANVADAVGSG